MQVGHKALMFIVLRHKTRVLNNEKYKAHEIRNINIRQILLKLHCFQHEDNTIVQHAYTPSCLLITQFFYHSFCI
jgi:hypothetical protein